jgi:hypothetical protein
MLSPEYQPTAAEVLEFLDYFAGQENDAEEVRDFVQLAARFVDGCYPLRDWEQEPILSGFVEWLKEKHDS